VTIIKEITFFINSSFRFQILKNAKQSLDENPKNPETTFLQRQKFLHRHSIKKIASLRHLTLFHQQKPFNSINSTTSSFAKNYLCYIIILYLILFFCQLGEYEISHEPYPETSLHWNVAVQGSGQVFATLP